MVLSISTDNSWHRFTDITCSKDIAPTSTFHSARKLTSPNFHCQTTIKNAKIRLSWHYKVPLSNPVTAPDEQCGRFGPLCNVQLLLHQKFMDFTTKGQHTWKIMAYHAKCQNSWRMTIKSWLPIFLRTLYFCVALIIARFPQWVTS